MPFAGPPTLETEPEPAFVPARPEINGRPCCQSHEEYLNPYASQFCWQPAAHSPRKTNNIASGISSWSTAPGKPSPKGCHFATGRNHLRDLFSTSYGDFYSFCCID